MTLRPRIRLLHTSDLHLGTDVDAYGPAWHGVECLCAIEIVAQAAIEAECDLLLIAGDLFDSNRVSDRLVGGLVRILSDLPLETVIVPGNHDAYDETSVYHRFERHTPSRTIQVMHDPDGRWAEFPQLGLSVWGRPIVVHEPAYRPFGSPVRRAHPEAEAWHVAMVHGHFEGEGDPPPTSGRSSPISMADLAHVDADYVALGHWHVATHIGDTRIPRWYSGSPTLYGLPRTAVLATLDPIDGVQIEMLPLHVTGRACPADGSG